MKIIALHCDYIRFKALKKALKEPEELDESEKKGKEVKECLVVLSAVEKNDEGFEEEISKKLIENIKIAGNETSVDLSNLDPAAYFLKVIQSNKEVKIFKIIKK